MPVRFIPTYVGHTSAPGTAPKGCPVHPHIRGAYVDMMHQISRHGGSSPHTWGIPAPPPGIYATPRFIPTYVGHTPRSCSLWSPITVHPHIRGAYGVAERVQPTQSVHPHIRGAYAPFCVSARLPAGSSPHTWGIPCNVWPKSRCRRFIPTYVGHTNNEK